MFRYSYLSACIAAVSIAQAAVAEDTEVLDSEKITVVATDATSKKMPLELDAQVSKVGAPVSELPYSVSIIDQEFISETGAKSIQDALLYTSGIYSGAFGIDTRVDSAKVRGVDPLKYLDGLRSHYSYYNNVRPSTYALEQIEVLKGPSSVLYGQGSVGGILNAVTKRPKAEEQGEFWAQVGSFERKQLAADWTGAVDKEGKVLVRLVALARDSGTQVDHVDDDELLFSPSFTWKVSEATELTLLANFQEREGGITAQFLPTQGTLEEGPKGYLSPSTYIGEPDWDRYDREQQAYTAEIKHQFNDAWSLTAVARYVDAETSTREHWANIPVPPDADGNIGRTIFTSDKSTQGLNWDARLNGQLTLGETSHKVLIGVDSQDIETDEWNRYYGAYAGTAINAYDPVYGSVAAIPSASITDPASVTTEQLGFYVADHINWGNVVISLAARHDKVDTTSEGSSTTTSSATTGHAGLMYQFASGISPYVSYSESFEPNTGTDGTPANNLLEPTEGEQTEYGIKYLSPDNNTSITFAYFDIEQLNRVTNGVTPGGVQQVGAEIDGWELEVRKNWNQLSVLFNYSDLDAKDGNGGRLPYLAERQSSIWTSYKFGNGFRSGLGVRYVSNNVGWGGSPVVDGVTLVDAMVGYETANWDFTADVKNLGDKTYVSWCRYASADCGFGEELNATLNARYKF